MKKAPLRKLAFALLLLVSASGGCDVRSFSLVTLLAGGSAQFASFLGGALFGDIFDPFTVLQSECTRNGQPVDGSELPN